jgi:uncharacterized protein (DUF342 family)
MNDFDKYFSIEVENLKMQVWLKVYESDRVSLRDIVSELKSRNIVFGINKPLLKEITENNFPAGKYLIAEGTTPIVGENSTIECMVPITPPPPDININNESNKYFPIRITNVRKGQRLFRFIKATLGAPGYNVFGEEVPPTAGKKISFLKGKNTDYSDDEKNYLIATKDGNFVYEGHQCYIETNYEVDGDLSTVNGKIIEFCGNLIVQGDIRIGVTLKVDGNLTVMGAVEDASIECGGNVDIKGGILGSGTGKVVANGDVSFLHAYNYTVKSRSSIKVGKIAMNCDLTAKIIDSPRASICGGSTLAFKKIEIQDLGRERYAKTTVALGGKLNHMILSNERDAEILSISRKFQLSETKLGTLNQATTNRTLTREQEEGIYSIQLVCEQLNNLLNQRKQEKEELRNELKDLILKLIVNGTIYENVNLMMNDIDIPIIESVTNTTFNEKNYRITMKKNY